MTNEFKSGLPVLIGPPGVGKTTIVELANRLPQIKAIDGDSFISPEGVLRLQNNTWDDSDRRAYLSSMARGAIEEINNNQRIVLIDAMTTRWMRRYFYHEVTSMANVNIRWVEVVRKFDITEIDLLIEERRIAGHPINSIETFEKYYNQFESLEPPFIRLTNPGISASIDKLHIRVKNLMHQLYES